MSKTTRCGFRAQRVSFRNNEYSDDHVVGDSIATNAPKYVGITRNIHGHATLRMSEKHYNQASMVSVLQRLHPIILADWTKTPSDTKLS
jgi:hypothetical protein